MSTEKRSEPISLVCQNGDSASKQLACSDMGKLYLACAQ
jgi:hypothetical protein